MSKRETWLLRWRYRLEYLVFQLAVCLLQILSPRQAVQLARGAAFLVCRCLPRRLTRYEVARENLRRAFPGRYSDAELDAVIFAMWVHLFRMIVEIAQLPRKLRLTNFRGVFEFYNREPVVRAACSDRPMILISGHYGNWEMSLAVFGMFGFRMHAVARPLDNPYLHQWFERFRRHTGHELIAKKGAFARMADVLEAGGTVAVLGDQDAGPRGTFVEFFGRPASTFPTLARLAVEFDACLCVGYSRRLPDDFDRCRWVRYELGCEAIIDPRHFSGEYDDRVARITQEFSWALERAIRRSPEQYFWIHRRWKTRPDSALSGQKSSRRAA